MAWWTYLSGHGLATSEDTFFKGWGCGVNATALPECPSMDFRLGYDVGVLWRRRVLRALGA